LKNKFTKILGVAVTLGIALVLVAGFALSFQFMTPI